MEELFEFENKLDMYVHIFNRPRILFKPRNNKQSLISKHKKMKTGIFQIDYVYF